MAKKAAAKPAAKATKAAVKSAVKAVRAGCKSTITSRANPPVSNGCSLIQAIMT